MEQEHAQIIREYESFFESMTPHDDQVVVRTKEDKVLRAQWTSGGWSVNDNFYESFESAMMTLSPSFQAHFHQKLTAGLLQLSDQGA